MKQAACFCNSPSFDQKTKNRNWASWPSVGTSSLQNQPISLRSSRKLTNSSLRQQGTFFSVPGRKSLRKMLENPVWDADPIIGPRARFNEERNNNLVQLLELN